MAKDLQAEGSSASSAPEGPGEMGSGRQVDRGTGDRGTGDRRPE
jgi:hypothetical protein